MCERHPRCSTRTTIRTVDVQGGLQDARATQQHKHRSHQFHACPASTASWLKVTLAASRMRHLLESPHCTTPARSFSNSTCTGCCKCPQHSMRNPLPPPCIPALLPHLLQSANQLQAPSTCPVAYRPHHASRLGEQEQSAIGVAHHVGEVGHLKVRRHPALTRQHASLHGHKW